MASGGSFTSLVGAAVRVRTGELAEHGRLTEQRERWRADPALWVRERLGGVLWSKQAEILESVRDHKLTAVQSCHGVGKSVVAAMAILWYVDTHTSGDVFVISTAPTWPQITAVLWRYLRRMHRHAGLDGYITQQAEWKIDGDLVGYGRKPADTDASGMQGLHGGDPVGDDDTEDVGVLAVIDEACGVRQQIWTAIDSMTTTEASRTLAIGNPDRTGGQFHAACTGQDPGWNVVQISAFDSPRLTGEHAHLPDRTVRGLVSPEWVEDKARRWGTSSPLYAIKVLGEFADDANALIPSTWVYLAMQRWHDWDEAGRPEPEGHRWFSADVARFGDDATAIATRQGDTVLTIDMHEQLDNVQIFRIMHALLEWPQSMSVVDAGGGHGSGVIDQLRHAGRSPVSFDGGAGTEARDIAGILRFRNVRSAAYWGLRELLDPYRGATLRLPPDEGDELLADLTTPTWWVTPGPRGSVIDVEPKEDFALRLGRSPDRGDAVAMAMWAENLHDGRDPAAAIGGLQPRQYDGLVPTEHGRPRSRRGRTRGDAIREDRYTRGGDYP